MVKETCTYVMIPRMHLMLHPVGPISSYNMSKKKADLSYCCLLSPQDLGKHLIGMTAMEIIL